MATDNRNSGSSSPPFNPYNPYNSQFPRARYDKYGTENNSGSGNIAVITPAVMGVPRNQTYGMPPTDTTIPPPNNPYNSQFPRARYDKYGMGNNSGMGNIAVITPAVMGVPRNQTYGMPPTDTTVPPPNNPYNSQFPRARYDKYGMGNNSGMGNIAVITPAVMGVPKNQTYGMPPTDTTVPPPNNPYNSQFPRARYDKYGTENNGGMGNIAVITPAVMGVPKNQTYGMPPTDTTVPPPNNPYNSQTYGMPPPEYAEGLEEVKSSDASIRRGFMRKVYLTFMIQLLITTGIICVFLYWEALKTWTSDTVWFTAAMMPATLVLIIVLACCGDIRRKVPLNFIFLGLLTIVEGLMLGSLTVFFKAEPVLWAVGATALVTLSLILFTLQSKWELTYRSGILWALCWSLISFGLLCAILRSQYVSIVLACLGTIVFSVYLVFDSQSILRGKHHLGPEEYIVAALCLNLDLVTLFLFIIKLFGDYS